MVNFTTCNCSPQNSLQTTDKDSTKIYREVILLRNTETLTELHRTAGGRLPWRTSVQPHPAHAGSRRFSCPGSRPDRFLISLYMEGKNSLGNLSVPHHPQRSDFLIVRQNLHSLVCTCHLLQIQTFKEKSAR